MYVLIKNKTIFDRQFLNVKFVMHINMKLKLKFKKTRVYLNKECTQ